MGCPIYAKSYCVRKRKEDGFEKSCEALQSPSDTLQRFVNNDKTPEECVKLQVGRNPVLLAYLETKLAEYLIEMDECFYGLRREDVKRMAYQLTVRNNIPHPFQKKLQAGPGLTCL